MPKVKKPKRVRQRHYLRQWREFRELSQERMAARMGIAQSTYQRIEANITPYNQDTMEMAAEALLCTVADIVTRNPLDKSAPWSLLDSLKKADPDTRARAVAVLEALLKTGT